MKLYTLLKQYLTKVTPISKGGTGAVTAVGAIANLKSDIIDTVYPVGSIYISPTSTSPATLFGGTWVQLKDRFLLGAGDTYSAGSTGGSATHTLSVNEMPSHTHTFTGSSVTTSSSSPSSHSHDLYTGNAYGGSGTQLDGVTNRWSSYRRISAAAQSSGSHYHSVTLNGSNANTGGNGAHNNMPPYLTVYMWKRTA